MAMLNDTRWLVVMGTKGTCKTSIASGLAEHLALGLTGSHNSDTIVRFSLGKDGLDVSGVVWMGVMWCGWEWCGCEW